MLSDVSALFTCSGAPPNSFFLGLKMFIAYIELNSENFSFSNFGYSRQFFSKILKIFVDFQDFSLQNKKNQKLLGIQSKF